MTPNEAKLIEDMFTRIAAADRADKDQEALRLINAKMAANPNAAYVLVQTLLVQEQALKAWQEQAQKLEAEKAALEANADKKANSFLPAAQAAKPSLWRRSAPSDMQQPAAMPNMTNGAANGASPYPPAPYAQPAYGNGGMFGGGGSFLGTALTTAAGVAGGMLLYNGISHMLSPNYGGSGGAGAHNASGSAAPSQEPNHYSNANDQTASEPMPGVSHADYSPSDAGFGGDLGSDFGADSGGFDTIDV